MAVIMYLTLGLGPLHRFVDDGGRIMNSSRELVALLQGTPIWHTLKRRMEEDVEQLIREEISWSSSTPAAACVQDQDDIRLVHIFQWDGTRRKDDPDVQRAMNIYRCSHTKSLEDSMFSFWEEALETKDAWQATASILPQLLTKDKVFRVVAKPYHQITRTEYLTQCGVPAHGTGALLQIIEALGDLRQHVYNAAHGTLDVRAPDYYRMPDDDLVAYLCTRDGTEEDRWRRDVAMKPLRLIHVYLSSRRENMIPVVDYNHGGRIRALARWILGDKDEKARVGPLRPDYGDVVNLFSVLGKPSPLLLVRVKTRDMWYDGCRQLWRNYQEAKKAFITAHPSPLPDTGAMLEGTVPPLTDAALAHLYDNLYNRYEYYKHKCVQVVDDGSNPDRNTPVLLDDMYDVVLRLCAMLDPVRLDHLDEECAQRESLRKKAEERLEKELEMEKEMERRSEDEKEAYFQKLRETRAQEEIYRKELDQERRQEERWRRLARLQTESERRKREQEERRQRKKARLHVARETTEKERRDGEEARRRAVVEDQERQMVEDQLYKEWAYTELNKRCNLALDGRMPDEDEIDKVVAADVVDSLENVDESTVEMMEDGVHADLEEAGGSVLLRLNVARARAEALRMEIMDEKSILRGHVKTEVELLHKQCRVRKPSADAIRLVDQHLGYQRGARRRRRELDHQLASLQLAVLSKNKRKLVENIARERHLCCAQECTPLHEVLVVPKGFPLWHEATELYERQHRLDLAIVGQQEQKGIIVSKTLRQRLYADHVKRLEESCAEEEEKKEDEEAPPILSEAQLQYRKRMCDQLDARCSMALNGRAPTPDEITQVVESDLESTLQRVLHDDPGSQSLMEMQVRMNLLTVDPTRQVEVAIEKLRSVRETLAERIDALRYHSVKSEIEAMVLLCQVAPPEEDVHDVLEEVIEQRRLTMKDTARLRALSRKADDPRLRKKYTDKMTENDGKLAVMVTGSLRPEAYDQLILHTNAMTDILYHRLLQNEMMTLTIIPLMQKEKALKAVLKDLLQKNRNIIN